MGQACPEMGQVPRDRGSGSILAGLLLCVTDSAGRFIFYDEIVKLSINTVKVIIIENRFSYVSIIYG